MKCIQKSHYEIQGKKARRDSPSMGIEIDQSGKIEQLSKNTFLCLSNRFWDIVVLKARDKRRIQEVFRRNGQIRNFILFTFCACLSLLIKRNLRKSDYLIIDREYSGKEHIIKKILLEMFDKRSRFPELEFSQIGRKSMAHNRAYAGAIGKLRVKKVIKLDEIWREIKKTEVGKRLKNA